MAKEPQFTQDGIAVANWTNRFGVTLTRTTEAHTELIAAITSAINDPRPETLERLRAAGQKLASVSEEALGTPPTGIPGIDRPRRSALKLLRQAGRMIADAQMDVLAGASDPDVPHAAELLAEGTDLLGRAAAATTDLTRRLVALRLSTDEARVADRSGRTRNVKLIPRRRHR